jgi:hypothetical protein
MRLYRSNRTARNRITFALALLAGCATVAADARAQCGSVHGDARNFPPGIGGVPAPNLALAPGLRDPEVERNTEQKRAPEHEGTASIVGLWRIKLTAGGKIIDEGWDLWHSDGTEVLVDAPFGSVCPGIWKKTGFRTYRLTHPAFNFDASGKDIISVFVYRAEVTLDSSGNIFAGVFTWDSYDFAGNPIPSSHTEGTLEARRVTINYIPFF